MTNQSTDNKFLKDKTWFRFMVVKYAPPVKNKLGFVYNEVFYKEFENTRKAQDYMKYIISDHKPLAVMVYSDWCGALVGLHYENVGYITTTFDKLEV